MSRPAFALLAILLAVLLAVGCMSREPRHDRSKETSYNRRELPPSPGILSGSDGQWTIYDNAPPPPDPDPEPACEETSSDDESEVCDPPVGHEP